ncbi:MAG: radical SAM protein, partial [Blastocatellia bacterium]|nr:radical SAM protein [Blastocatellia bacterium]
MHQPDLKTDPFTPLKLFSHMETLYKWSKGENVYPITMELGPSTVCNHFCTWCMHGGYFGSHKGDDKKLKLYPETSVMKFSFYRGLCDELATLGTKSMIFSGSGEPFVNPELPDFIEYTKKAGIDVATITHGGLLTPERIRVVVDNLTWIRISLNAGTAKTRLDIHKVDDFEKVLGNLALMAEEKKKRSSKLHIGAGIAVCPENWEEVYEGAKRVRETGIDYYQIKPVIWHPMSKNKQYEEEFFKNALPLIRRTKAELETDTFKVFIKEDQFAGVLSPDYEKSTYKKCYSTFFPVIEANKKVYYCSQTRGLPEFCLGDLGENTFKEIWESEQRKKVIEGIDVM